MGERERWDVWSSESTEVTEIGERERGDMGLVLDGRMLKAWGTSRGRKDCLHPALLIGMILKLTFVDFNDLPQVKFAEQFPPF